MIIFLLLLTPTFQIPLLSRSSFSHAQVVDGGGRHLVLPKFARAGVNITRGHGQSSVRQEPDEVTRASTGFPRARLFLCVYLISSCLFPFFTLRRTT
uniref:Uncharacterized protein n=1 Tax=Ixodes ricinus TaxID=34613 RepID=A0A6B0UDP3_IXORI